jgi:hypothetical protein
MLPSLCSSLARISKRCECSFCTKNRWNRTPRQCSKIRRSTTSFFNMPDPPRFWPAENLYILRQCAFIVFIPRQTYGHFPSSSPHLIPSSNDANSSMGSSTNGGTSNSTGVLRNTCPSLYLFPLCFGLLSGQLVLLVCQMANHLARPYGISTFFTYHDLPHARMMKMNA